MTLRSGNVALVVCLVLVMGSGPIVVFICSAIGPLLIDEFRLTNAEFGRLISSSFVVAALASAVLGRVVDRITPLAAVIGLHCLSAGALLLIGLTRSLQALAVGLAISGLVQALGNPVTNRIVAMRVPVGRRGAVMGVKQSGVQVSQLAAGLVAPPLALAIGWSFSFVAALPIALLGTVIGIMTLRSSRTSIRPESTLPGVPASMWPLAGYAVLTGAALQATVAYLPVFAFEVLDWTIGHAGLTVSLAGAAGVCARILWGHWTDSMEKIGGPLVTVAVGGSVAVVLLMFAAQLDLNWLLWLGVGLLGLTGVAANVVVMVVVVRLAPLEQLGRASGLLATGLFVGFAIGPVSFGVLVDTTGRYTVAWGAIALLYLLASLLAVHIGRRQGRAGRSRFPRK